MDDRNQPTYTADLQQLIPFLGGDVVHLQLAPAPRALAAVWVRGYHHGGDDDNVIVGKGWQPNSSRMSVARGRFRLTAKMSVERVLRNCRPLWFPSCRFLRN